MELNELNGRYRKRQDDEAASASVKEIPGPNSSQSGQQLGTPV